MRSQRAAIGSNCSTPGAIATLGIVTTTPAVRDPRRRSWGYRLTAALSVVLVFTAAGCANLTSPLTSTVEGSPAAAAPSTAADCNKVNYPLIDIPPRARAEPTMQIPQPPGWEVVQTKRGQGLRSALTNQALTANQYAPTVAVTLGSEPSQWSAQELFDEQRSGLVLGAEFQSITPTTVCGQPAEISEYTMTPESVSAPLFVKLLMAVAESEDVTYLVALSVVTSEPDNPIYQRDSQAILDGFVFVPSGSQ